MPKTRIGDAPKRTTIVLTRVDRYCLDRLAETLGVSLGSVMRMALRHYAQSLGLWSPDDDMEGFEEQKG